MEILTRQEAADRLGISVSHLDEERRAGRIAYIQQKKQGRVFITPEACDAYLVRGTHEARPVNVVVNTFRHRRKK